MKILNDIAVICTILKKNMWCILVSIIGNYKNKIETTLALFTFTSRFNEQKCE